MPDSQVYRFFRDNGPNQEGTFLFSRRIDPALRPSIGDSISIDLTLDRHTITRDEIPLS